MLLNIFKIIINQIENNNIMEMNYTVEGSGDKTIVFIHGLSDSLEYWRVLSSRLQDDYRIVLYDIRGHGKSPYKPFTIGLLVDDLYNLLLKLNIEKTSLIGFSMGGNVALSFAIKYPHIADRLVIMSSFSECDENLKSKFIELKTAITHSFEDFYDAIIHYVIMDDVFNKNRDVLEIVKRESAKNANLEAIANGIDMGMDLNITDQLCEIDNPTLILSGREDDLISQDLTDIIKDNIKNSNAVVFDNIKHNLLVGKTVSEILKLIRQFI